jgi:hypothetical protein
MLGPNDDDYENTNDDDYENLSSGMLWHVACYLPYHINGIILQNTTKFGDVWSMFL